jgi:hypothetical protein
MAQLSMFAPPPEDTARAARGHAGSRLTTTVAYCLSGATLLLLAAFIGGL